MPDTAKDAMSREDEENWTLWLTAWDQYYGRSRPIPSRHPIDSPDSDAGPQA